MITIVNDGERLVPFCRRERSYKVCIAQNAVRSIVAVCVIPVVASVDHIERGDPAYARDLRSLRHRTAQALRGREGAFSENTGVGDDRGHFEPTVAQPHTIAPVSCVKPERYSRGVHLPEGERCGSGLDAHADGSLLRVKDRVPGQRTFRLQWPPLQISIAPLPRVAKNKNFIGKATLPAKMYPLHRESWRLKRNRGLLCPWKKIHAHAGGVVAPGPRTASSREVVSACLDVANVYKHQVRLREDRGRKDCPGRAWKYTSATLSPTYFGKQNRRRRRRHDVL